MSEMLSIESKFNRSVLPLFNEDQVAYMLVRLRALSDPGGQRAPLNWSLLIDRSGSMAGEKLNSLKSSLNDVVARLNHDDLVSLVLFNHDTQVAIPAQQVVNRESIDREIQQITADGGTRISDAMQTALNETLKNAGSGRLSRVLLLTDGQTQADEEKCLQIAREYSDHGIPITALGLGEDWNDELVEQIATLSQGRSEYIESPDQIGPIFDEETTILANTVADNVNLTLRFSRGIQLRRLFRVVPETEEIPNPWSESERTTMCSLGGLTSDMGQALLAELLISPKVEPGTYRMARAEVTANFPALALYGETAESDLVATFGTPPSEPDAEVTGFVENAAIAHQRSVATRRLQQGDVTGATRVLRNLATRALNMGQTDLARTAESEAENLEKEGEMSSRGTKLLSRGTKRL